MRSVDCRRVEKKWSWNKNAAVVGGGGVGFSVVGMSAGRAVPDLVGAVEGESSLREWGAGGSGSTIRTSPGFR